MYTDLFKADLNYDICTTMIIDAYALACLSSALSNIIMVQFSWNLQYYSERVVQQHQKNVKSSSAIYFISACSTVHTQEVTVL